MLLTYSINVPLPSLKLFFVVGVATNLFSSLKRKERGSASLHLGGQLCIYKAVSFKGLISAHFPSVPCTMAPSAWVSLFIFTEYTSLCILETAADAC